MILNIWRERMRKSNQFGSFLLRRIEWHLFEKWQYLCNEVKWLEQSMKCDWSCIKFKFERCIEIYFGKVSKLFFNERKGRNDWHDLCRHGHDGMIDELLLQLSQEEQMKMLTQLDEYGSKHRLYDGNIAKITGWAMAPILRRENKQGESCWLMCLVSSYVLLSLM